jgi:hypothetical protein
VQPSGNAYAPGLTPGGDVLDRHAGQADPDGWEDPMNAIHDDVRTEALFASHVQRSQRPTPELIRDAVTATVDRLGAGGCAEMVAQEFGEHPDCALHRMRWARRAVRMAYA